MVVDPRSDGLFMMASLWPSVTICLSYVVLVTIIGPRLMKGRKPLDIKNLMVGYNFTMVTFCGYIMYEVCNYVLALNY